MILQQILVEATDFTSPEGNVVAARSPNIDDDLAQKMARWATVRTGLLPRHLKSIFYTPLNRRYSLLGRTYAGGYDSHGDRALYSQIVLLKPAHLRDCHHNVVTIARQLNSSGAWTLNSQPQEALPEISLPSPVINTFEYVEPPNETAHIEKSMDLHDRIGLTEATEPLAFMGAFLNSIEVEKRSKISFSIGRRFFENAPFQISFYPGGDLHLERELIEKQIYPIRLRSREAQYHSKV